MTNSDERIDDLDLDGLKIIQNKKLYTFTSDSVLLANFVKTKHKDVCVEIGSGTGIISILVNYKEKPQKIYAFEVQSEPYLLIKRNLQLNKILNIEPINDRVQNWANYIQPQTLDVVFSNPPYFKYDEKVCGDNTAKVISRFDKLLKPEELFECASKMLKPFGKLYFMYDSSRLDEIISKLKQYHFAPKRMYFVHPNENKNSSIFLCEATLGGGEGLIVMPPLIANSLDGDYIQTIQKLYKQKG